MRTIRVDEVTVEAEHENTRMRRLDRDLWIRAIVVVDWSEQAAWLAVCDGRDTNAAEEITRRFGQAPEHEATGYRNCNIDAVLDRSENSWTSTLTNIYDVRIQATY